MEKKVKKAPWLYVVRYGSEVVACYTSALLCVALVKRCFSRCPWTIHVERYRQFFPGACDLSAIEVEKQDITNIILKAI